MTFLFVPELAISGFLWFAARAVISARGAVTESSSRQGSFKVPSRPRFAFYLMVVDAEKKKKEKRKRKTLLGEKKEVSLKIV